MKRKIITILSIMALVLFSGCSDESEVDERLKISRILRIHTGEISDLCEMACDNSQTPFIHADGSPNTKNEILYCRTGCYISHRESMDKIMNDNIKVIKNKSLN